MTRHHFALNTYPFSVAVSNSSAYLHKAVSQLYPSAILGEIKPDIVYDFDLSVQRRWYGLSPEYRVGSASEHFRMAEKAHLPAIFEWAFNWTLASFQHHYLAFHAAVLQKGMKTVIMPAAPGSGKSTLSALMMLAGWRLLSDETCLVDIASGLISPNVRPISLKNRSLDVIRSRHPDSALALSIQNTIKGTVGYLLPSEQSWQHYKTHCRASHVIFPRYDADSTKTLIEHVALPETVSELIRHSFNYSVLAAEGFDALCNLVNSVKSMRLCYADADDVLNKLEQLT